MRKFKYQETILSTINSFYNSVQAVIDTGEKQTRPLYCLNSVRQGCPLSVPLFLIYIEPLLRMLKNRIKGIKSFRTEAKVAGFVYDITVYLKDYADIHTTGGTISQFCRWSGAKLNGSKTKIMQLGEWKGDTRWRIPWVQKAMELNILGITFEKRIESKISRRWNKAAQVIVGKCKDYTPRTLTLHQRANLIKAHILPPLL